MTTTHLAPELTTVPARALLTVDGIGAPEAPEFTRAIRALFTTRAALGERDDVPLEGTYAQDGDWRRFDLDAPDGWHWRLAVPVAPQATPERVAAAARFGAPVVLRRPAAQAVAQLLHHGPYADEAPSLAALYAHVAAAGLAPAGPHTEVYLVHPGSAPPAVLRTVLRVPVR